MGRLSKFGLMGVLALVFWLYAPFVSNAPVFDDHNLLSTLRVYDSATDFLPYRTRVFPRFTIGFVHVLSGENLVWNRYANMALHGLVVIALFSFVRRAMVCAIPDERSRQLTALVGCLWVALNPVAVYATGYLIQRTIVLATLFSIASVTLYLRAQHQRRNADVFSAALLAFLSVMCKEHAVLLPLAALALTPLVAEYGREALMRAAGYLVLTVPGMIWALLHRGREAFGSSYEVFSSDVLSQFVRPAYLESSFSLWLTSAATQLLLFWKYLFLWFVPNSGWMSADLRVDFQALWSGPYVYLGAIVSAGLMLGAVRYLWSNWIHGEGRSRLAALSAVFLFAAIQFVVELSVVRVQEPFVLYRSFLWMPAYMLLFCLLLGWVHQWFAGRTAGRKTVDRIFWVAALAVSAALFPLAQDRLRSFSSDEALWQDAKQKLQRADVAGADRIYYNLAGEAYKRKDYSAALHLSEKAIETNPGAFQGYVLKGSILLVLGQINAAERAFDDAGMRNPQKNFLGYLEFKRCALNQARGEVGATADCLRRSAKLGYEPARFQLEMAGIPLEE